MTLVISRCLKVFTLFTWFSYASGSSCANLCPGLFNRDKCCDDNEMQFPSLSSSHDTEGDGLPKSDMWTMFTSFASVIGVIFVILIICSYCPCCILYKHRKNGTIYRRFGVSNTTSGQRRKGRGVQKTKRAEPAVDQTPSVTVVASHPVQVNFPQPYTQGQMVGHTVYNHLPQPQAAMQSPPPCTVAVICNSNGKQPPYNPMFQ